jgi:hypothetical protein
VRNKFIESVAQLIISLIGISLFLWVYTGYQNSIRADRAEKDSTVREAKEIILNADIEAYRNRQRY